MRALLVLGGGGFKATHLSPSLTSRTVPCPGCGRPVVAGAQAPRPGTVCLRRVAAGAPLPHVCLGVRSVRKNELTEVELLDQKVLLNLDADK